MGRSSCLPFVAAAVLVWAAGAAAEVPRVIHQEGLLTNARGEPLGGPVDLVFHLYAAAEGGAPVWSEEHRGVRLTEGYYSVLLGSVRALTGDTLLRARYLAIQVGAAELQPRTPLAATPFALVAERVEGGPVNATQIAVGGRVVVDGQGRWVGDPTGLRGPEGPAGPPGPPGPAGGDGSPDTPAQVRDKLKLVDGSRSGVDADLLDGLDSTAFLRAGQPIDAATLGGHPAAAFVRTAAQVLELLKDVDGTRSGLDADRLDGLDSSQFVRTGEQVRDLLRDADGSGSLLDADRLDGVDSSQFMRADRDTSTVGALAVRGNVTAQAELSVAGTLRTGQVRVAGGARVGVGVADPAFPVDVNGIVRADGLVLKESDAPCNAGAAGTIRWSGRSFEGCDGRQWVPIGRGAAGSGFAFDCVPGEWSYRGNRIICERTIELPTEMAVLAHINGHWGTDHGWCMSEILFDGEQPYSHESSPYRNKDGIHAYTPRWKAASMVRTKILPPGRHTVRYSVNEHRACWLNGSSMHGVAIPTYGQGVTMSCVPGGWSYGANTVVCSTTFDLPRRSVVTAHVNGHWRVDSGWCMLEVLYDGEQPYYTGHGSSPYRNKDALHGYGSTWRGVSTTRSKILDAGRHTVRYAISTSGRCWINGSSLHGFAVPAEDGAQQLDCVPGDWSYRGNRVVCERVVDLPTDSLVVAHVNGHWSTHGWCMTEVLFDDERQYNHGSSPYINKDGLHGYPSGWQPVFHVRSKLLPAGRHSIRYAVTEHRGCWLNGSSMRGFIVPR